jgi:hypothetical protein
MMKEQAVPCWTFLVPCSIFGCLARAGKHPGAVTRLRINFAVSFSYTALIYRYEIFIAQLHY